jgi:hypothetical protein
MIKIDVHAAGVLLFLISLEFANDQIRRCRICKFLQTVGRKGLLTLLIKSKRISTKYMPITYSSEVGLALAARNTNTFFSFCKKIF